MQDVAENREAAEGKIRTAEGKSGGAEGEIRSAASDFVPSAGEIGSAACVFRAAEGKIGTAEEISQKPERVCGGAAVNIGNAEEVFGMRPRRWCATFSIHDAPSGQIEVSVAM